LPEEFTVVALGESDKLPLTTVTPEPPQLPSGFVVDDVVVDVLSARFRDIRTVWLAPFVDQLTATVARAVAGAPAAGVLQTSGVSLGEQT
jgi:hypothetical protein